MDPYKVLGVTSQATPEQIKEAYTKLAKKYHPDINQGNVDAEQKMKEVNAAYDLLKHGTSDGYSSNGFYRTNGDGRRDESFSEFTAARNYINSGYFSEAVGVLSRISERSSVWYYYMAVARMGLGDRAAAMQNIDIAIKMEPNNYEYIELKNRMSYSSNVYRTYASNNYPRTGTAINPCVSLFVINLLMAFCSGGRLMWFCC